MVTKSQLLLEKAQRCRELADTAMTEEGRDILREIAVKYELDATAAIGSPQRSTASEALVA